MIYASTPSSPPTSSASQKERERQKGERQLVRTRRHSAQLSGWSLSQQVHEPKLLSVMTDTKGGKGRAVFDMCRAQAPKEKSTLQGHIWCQHEPDQRDEFGRLVPPPCVMQSLLAQRAMRLTGTAHVSRTGVWNGKMPKLVWVYRLAASWTGRRATRARRNAEISPHPLRQFSVHHATPSKRATVCQAFDCIVLRCVGRNVTPS